MANGNIVNWQTLVNNGDASRRFDIVILAEGFKQAQLDLFDDRAQLLSKRLLALPPFDTVANLINVHTVRVASTESGASNFPKKNTPKQTYFGVSGYFHKQGIQNPPAGFLGTDSPVTVLNAAQNVAPSDTLELFIVLVNSKGQGASAFPENQMVFTTLRNADADFVNFAAHECCHAIAGTAEEYIDGDPATPDKTYLNQASEKQRLSGDVWWKDLSLPKERDGAGGFKAVHLFGDPDVDFTATHKPVFRKRTARNGMLGLYWGCQDIDPLPGPYDAYTDPRGRHFYRGMATCKMRRSKDPLCRVCSELITRRIRAAAL